jgi:hypothetical protein
MRSPLIAVALACFVAVSLAGCGGRDVATCWVHKGFDVVGSPGDYEVSTAANQVEVRTGMSEQRAESLASQDRAADFAVVDRIGGDVLAWDRKPTDRLRRRVQSCLS